MKAMTMQATRSKKAAVLLGFFVCCGVLLAFPAAAATGAKRGLAVCGNVLIPTLLPFMALASFLVESGLSDVLGRRLSRLTAAMFGLPGCCAAGILLAFVGGYPAGADACAKLVERGQLTIADARRMMRFSVVAGPAFVVGTVGAGLLGSPLHGWLLLVSQWAAALLLGIVGGGGRRKLPPSPPPKTAPKPLLAAASVAVGDAARAMVVMSGFVTVVSGGLSVLDAAGLPKILTDAVAAVSEVSVGCLAVAPNAVALAACIGFGGLSVCGQIATLFSFSVLDRGFFAARMAHAALAAGFAWILFCVCPLPVAVFAAGQVKTVPFSCGFTGSAALLATFVTAVLTLPQKPLAFFGDVCYTAKRKGRAE